jgi:hypothetical protein
VIIDKSRSYRRIDQLKTIAFDCGFGNEDAKLFGKLSKTATWEAMLETYGIPFPADSVDSVETRRKWLMRNVGRGGSYGWPPPPAAPLARQGNFSPGWVIPGTECKK